MESQYSSGDEEFSQEQIMSQIKYKTKIPRDLQWGEGIWTQKQKFRYVAYILYNKEFLNSKLQRRKNKIFKQMSKFVGTRNPTQCRSQNQKMFRRYKTLHKIVCEFKKEFGVQKFQSDYETCIKEIDIKFCIQGTQFRTDSQNLDTCQLKKKQNNDSGTQTDGQVVVLMSQIQYELWKSIKQSVVVGSNYQILFNNFYFNERYF